MPALVMTKPVVNMFVNSVVSLVIALVALGCCAVISAKPPAPPPFTCPVLTPSAAPPVDVRHIRPTDIKAFMAMGDSITAAFAAKENLKLDGIREFRGISWAIGGDDGAYTVPNFFARVSGHPHSPALGASLGDQIPLEAVKIKGHPVRDWDPRVDQLNGAVSLARVGDLNTQMDYLVSEAKKIKGLDFENDWKVLSILIGANNLCISCEAGRKDATPQYYEQNYRAILERVRTEIPKVFVNAVLMFNISGVYTQQQTSEYCRLMEPIEKNECPCMERADADRQAMDLHNVLYSQVIKNISADYAAKNYTDFAVVVQPCFESLPVFSLEYLSGVDCFHPSYLAHAAMGIGLWNNMLQPEGEKDTTLDPANVKLLCPAGGCTLSVRCVQLCLLLLMRLQRTSTLAEGACCCVASDETCDLIINKAMPQWCVRLRASSPHQFRAIHTKLT